MSAFDDIERNLEGPAGRLISSFDYLNESARPEAARVRELIDAALARYPASNREAMRNRLRSVDETGHFSAFFELALHDLALRQGCTVLAVEPAIVGCNRSPDFLVETGEGVRFYLEATLATGQSHADAGAERRMAEALAALDAIESPDFFLGVHTSGSLPTQPVSRLRLRREVQRWVDGLNYDEVCAAWERGTGIPSLPHEQHGMRLRIEAAPRRQTRGIAGERAIGLVAPEGVAIVQPHVAINSAVAGKAGRYGDLDLPYIIAVNALADFAERTSVVEALFGTEYIVMREVDGVWGGPEERRHPNGVWYGRQGPVNTRVSAVLSTQRLTPWSVGQRRARVTLNPWARLPWRLRLSRWTAAGLKTTGFTAPMAGPWRKYSICPPAGPNKQPSTRSDTLGGRLLLLLKNDIHCFLVLSEVEEGRVADLGVAGPLRELYLGDQQAG